LEFPFLQSIGFVDHVADESGIPPDDGIIGELANGPAFEVMLIALLVLVIERCGVFWCPLGATSFGAARGRAAVMASLGLAITAPRQTA
jgi:hypothetical protein